MHVRLYRLYAAALLQHQVGGGGGISSFGGRAHAGVRHFVTGGLNALQIYKSHGCSCMRARQACVDCMHVYDGTVLHGYPVDWAHVS